MRARSFKYGASALVLVLAFGGLLWTTLSEGTEYYKHVDEIMEHPEHWYGKRLQVHGHVVPGSILRTRDALDHRFAIEHNGSTVAASYTGVVPDNFKSGAEVVLRGTLGPDGIRVERNGIMAKCPSKHEPQP